MQTNINKPLLRASQTVFGACCLFVLPLRGHAQLFNNIPSGGGYKMDTTAFIRNLNARLTGNCVGYQFVVSYKKDLCTLGMGGEARRAQDAPASVMLPMHKFNVASVSKTITAAAALKALSSKGVSLDAPMYPYLPPNWTPGPHVKEITFRQLLNHTSGIRDTTEVDYADIEKYIQGGINASDMGKYSYNNTNFALFRFLIPRLTGVTVGEVNPAKGYGKIYMQYVQKNVFDPMGQANVGCKPTDEDAAQCYQFPLTAAHGTDFGDMTETNASRGWNLSAAQLNMFTRTLHYTNKILPPALSEEMRDKLLGYDSAGKTGKGISYFMKGGYYPGKDGKGNPYNAGELNSLIVGFGNDVQVALIVNSQLGPGKSPLNEVLAAFDESLKK